MIRHTTKDSHIHSISFSLSVSVSHKGVVSGLVGGGAVGTRGFTQILPIEAVNSMQQEVSHINRSFSRTGNGNPAEPQRIAGELLYCIFQNYWNQVYIAVNRTVYGRSTIYSTILCLNRSAIYSTAQIFVHTICAKHLSRRKTVLLTRQYSCTGFFSAARHTNSSQSTGKFTLFLFFFFLVLVFVYGLLFLTTYRDFGYPAE